MMYSICYFCSHKFEPHPWCSCCQFVQAGNTRSNFTPEPDAPRIVTSQAEGGSPC